MKEKIGCTKYEIPGVVFQMVAEATEKNSGNATGLAK